MPWALVLGAYVGSRLFYADLGLPLDDRSLAYFWQYLDLGQLRENLLEAVTYQHTQPPLYNLFLGLGLRADDPRRFFHAAAVAFGLVLHLGLFALMRRLRVRAWLAVLVAALFAWSPASILMELWIFYTYPVAALLVAAVALFHRGLSRERPGALLGALTLMALVVLTRSLFHLVWMAFAVAVSVAFSRRRRRALLVALVPLALASSVYLKNWAVFGRPEASTWMGFSLSRLVTTRAPRDLVLELRREGAVSELAASRPWLPLRRYPPRFRALPDDLPRVPVLTEPTRPGGHPNFNHGAYVPIARTFLDDARVILARSPETWWKSTQRAWQIHFLPIHDYTFFHEHRREAGPSMRAVERVYERLTGAHAFAAWDWGAPMPPFPERPAWAYAVVLGLALLHALGAVAVGRRSRAERATLLLAATTVAFVAVVGNSLEVGENNRFRFLSEPLSWCLIAVLLDRLLRALGRGARAIVPAWLPART